jgi:hypothetical protein
VPKDLVEKQWSWIKQEEVKVVDLHLELCSIRKIKPSGTPAPKVQT